MDYFEDYEIVPFLNSLSFLFLTTTYLNNMQIKFADLQKASLMGDSREKNQECQIYRTHILKF